MNWSPPDARSGDTIREAAGEDDWRAAIGVIAGRHGLSDDDWQMFPSGTAVVFGNRDHVIKLGNEHWVSALDTECSLLGHVEGRLPVATPRVVARGAVTDWPYLVMTRVAGASLDEVFSFADREQRLRLATRIGELMAALHVIDPPTGADSAWDGARWPAFVAERERDVVATHRRMGVAERWLERIEPFLATVDRPGDRLVTLHTELLDQHIFAEYDGASWNLCGVIDFADGRVGHPDYEWVAPIEFIFRGEPGMLGACMRGYGASVRHADSERARQLAAWALLHQFGSLRRVLTAAGAPEPASFDELVARVYDLS